MFPEVDRRVAKTERRGMDTLRAEALRTLITQVEDRNFGGLRSRFQWSRAMSPSRIVLLVVAILAGGLAAFLATHSDKLVAAPPPEAVTEIVQTAPTMQVLVAKATIGVGQKLTADSLVWQDWPESALRPEYVTVATTPDAIKDMTGSVARSEFLAGEPIRPQKLVQAGAGYLSAILDTGMRGVSVTIAAESASGGFVAPDDHVDVVLTRATPLGQASDTILSNVRVLAINARLGETNADGTQTNTDGANPDVFTDQAIATLELDPTGAEVVINATTQGKLSLVLRSITDTGEASRASLSPTNRAIRLSSPFWAK